MHTRQLAIKQLDKQLKEWQTTRNQFGKPQAGWIKTIRCALCMSVEQLANRLGLTRARIVQLEKAEANDAVTLRTLRKAADAMECELVYVIVPKGKSTLETIINNRAALIADERISRVAHSMALEKQSLDENTLESQKQALARSLAEHPDKKLWLEEYSEEKSKKQQNASFKALTRHLQKKKK